MKTLYLCTSLHHQELVEANNPQDARTFMQNAHPDDGEYCTYLATEEDRDLFNRSMRIELKPQKRFKPNQLDWVSEVMK